jgi:hypothetical protein
VIGVGSDFDVNPGQRVEVLRVGRDRTPVIIIDGFSSDPRALIARAATADFIDAGPVYPGVRAPTPSAYVDTLLAATAALMEQHFGAAPADTMDLCAFSMVTTPPAQLRPIQRIPHFDGPEDERIAFLHYLCAPHQGGTSFYRHRATGLERIRRDRVDEYRSLVVAELKADKPAQDYAGEDSANFERIHRVDAAFNRLVIYPGNALHSGDISANTVLSEDPHAGRLTINGFGLLRDQFQPTCHEPAFPDTR